MLLIHPCTLLLFPCNFATMFSSCCRECKSLRIHLVIIPYSQLTHALHSLISRLTHFILHSLFTSQALIQLITSVTFPHSRAQFTGPCQHHALVHRPVHLFTSLVMWQWPKHNSRVIPTCFKVHKGTSYLTNQHSLPIVIWLLVTCTLTPNTSFLVRFVEDLLLVIQDIERYNWLPFRYTPVLLLSTPPYS